LSTPAADCAEASEERESRQRSKTRESAKRLPDHPIVTIDFVATFGTELSTSRRRLIRFLWGNPAPLSE
jgi:hypothetical protein